jgi:acetoacetyl-CoA synthetase
MTKTPLWQPKKQDIEKSNLFKFIQYINQEYNKNLNDYRDLYDWSIHHIESFWESVLKFSEIKLSKTYDSITSKSDNKEYDIPRPKWFEGAKLNFAENLLWKNDDSLAIIHWAENSSVVRITYKELREKVAYISNGLRSLGVKKGDVVAGFVSNIPEAVIAMLATTSIGAIWSSCSPDFGYQGVMDRFGQINPKVLFSVNGYSYNGKIFNCLDKISQVTNEISSIEKTIIIDKVEIDHPVSNSKFLTWDKLTDNKDSELIFKQVDFDSPLYIMYSSGTTGTPKCIVHGVGGTLLQHWKELYLHTDLTEGDRIAYFTTCGWMMWNWLVSSLNIGATIFLFDGSPSYPNMNILFDAIEKERLSIFGTSPKFLTAAQKSGVIPRKTNDLSSLRVILSTGSPLSSENFDYVYQSIKEDVRLSSISGGTDIIGCFALGNPILPVYSEELQSIGLGMKVESWSEERTSLINQTGELVCLEPFPSMPIYFWNDENNQKYYEAYFDYFPNIWRHGDFVKVTPNGGLIILGRSDSTLNPGGVRIGTAEIYRIVEAMPEIKDSLVVGPKYEDDIRIILFVVMQDGYELSPELKHKIKSLIKDGATPRHIPKKIKQISEVPVTKSGKKVEIAVTKILNGEDINNTSALANPESLEQFRNIEL